LLRIIVAELDVLGDVVDADLALLFQLIGEGVEFVGVQQPPCRVGTNFARLVPQRANYFFRVGSRISHGLSFFLLEY
jgi:hypothetical protein